jgi:hypothetical protein
MSIPPIMLGGVPIVLHAGAPELSEETIGGSTVLRLSLGDAVKMQHYEKQAGTISGQGWMPPGLDGLDYSQPLELRTKQVSNIVGAGRAFTLTGTPRPDFAPWGQALVGDQWRRTACIYDAETNTAELDLVPGATLYQACWMPVYSVFASRPPKSQSSTHNWSIAWEET